MARKNSLGKIHRFGRTIVSAAVKTLLGSILLSVLLVLGLRWIDPPTSSFMVQRWLAGRISGESPPIIYNEWVSWSEIPAVVPLSILAAEDQRFANHLGFDLVEIRNAVLDYRQSGKLRGASTITQQVAKNLFLWKDQSALRKGLEAWFTVLLEFCLSKRRILEIYMNIAQFSDNTFGVGAASRRYFDKSVRWMNWKNASLLAAVLPNPVSYRLEKPTSFVRARGIRIERQARGLGVAYLNIL